MLDKFADELREQREKSGMSLQQIAAKTRIDFKFIEAIDKGNFSFLPELYVKAFIKQFAKTIGFDEILILKKYEAAKDGKEYQENKSIAKEELKFSEPTKTESPTDESQKTKTTKPIINYTEHLKSYDDDDDEKKSDEQKKSKKQILTFGIAGSVLLAVILIIYFFVIDKSNDIVVDETPIEEVINQNNQRYEEEQSETFTSDSSVAVASTDSLYLTFISRDTSWVKIIIDDVNSREVIIYPKHKITFTASKDFKATVGNSGVVSLQLNNKSIEFTGSTGSVRHFKLDKSGLIYLNTPPKLEQ